MKSCWPYCQDIYRPLLTTFTTTIQIQAAIIIHLDISLPFCWFAVSVRVKSMAQSGLQGPTWFGCLSPLWPLFYCSSLISLLQSLASLTFLHSLTSLVLLEDLYSRFLFCLLCSSSKYLFNSVSHLLWLLSQVLLPQWSPDRQLNALWSAPSWPNIILFPLVYVFVHYHSILLFPMLPLTHITHIIFFLSPYLPASNVLCHLRFNHMYCSLSVFTWWNIN